MRPLVDVGVVTWNTAELTATGLRRLLDTEQGCRLNVLVHDNASVDGTPRTLAERVPEADVVAGDVNLGFAGAVNRLLERSDAEWFFLLNSDAWPDPGAVGRLVQRALAQPTAAAVAPRLLRPDGTVEHSTHPFPSLGVALVDAVGARRLLPKRWAEAQCLEGRWNHDRPRTVDWAVGAGLLLRRAAVEKIGGFDERFFMYVEDLEWCWRARAAGWEIWFEPRAVVRHVGDASGSRRFGAGRAALEWANLRTFLDEALGERRARRYRGLATAALARQYALSRATGDAAAGHWRLQLRAALGFVPPPALLDGPAAPTRHRASPGGPDVAVVVPTRNRADRLERLVTALEHQTLAADRFEVVFVDDASTDGTLTVLGERAAATALSLRAVHSHTRRGPAAARNLGWRTTSAPVVAFTDDDCVPEPQWLEAGLTALGDERRLVVGRTAPPDEQLALARRPFARVMDVDSTRFFESCNVLYRRGDLEAVGGFDERFRRPSGEDTHLGLRVTELGVEAVFAPLAEVRHDVRPGGLGQAVLERTRWADLPLVLKGRAYARRRCVDHVVFWKATHPRVLLAVAGLLLARRRRGALALLVPWLHWRLVRDPVACAVTERVANLPGAAVLDLTEVATMVRGSWRHRTVLL